MFCSLPGSSGDTRFNEFVCIWSSISLYFHSHFSLFISRLLWPRLNRMGKARLALRIRANNSFSRLLIESGLVRFCCTDTRTRFNVNASVALCSWSTMSTLLAQIRLTHTHLVNISTSVSLSLSPSPHVMVQRVFKTLSPLYRSNPLFFSLNSTHSLTNLTIAIRRIQSNSMQRSVAGQNKKQKQNVSRSILTSISQIFDPKRDRTIFGGPTKLEADSLSIIND